MSQLLHRRGHFRGGPWYSGLLVAYQPKGAASLAASYANMGTGGASNNATPIVAPTWDAINGWIFNGSSQHLNTNTVIQGAWTTAIRIANGPAANPYTYCLAGAFNGSSARLEVWTNITPGPGHFEPANAVAKNAGAGVQAGVIVIAGPTVYVDGIDRGVGLGGAWTGGTLPLKLGSRGAGEYWLGNILAAATTPGVLSAPEVAVLSAAMAAL